MIRRILIALAAPCLVFAQVPTSAPGPGPSVPIRQLGAATATSAMSFGQVLHLRPLSDGRVLVNDGVRHQVVLLDAKLANPKVVIDSAGGVNMYGLSSGALVPFAGDSTLFVDRATAVFLVIDPKGDVTRVMSMPAGNPGTYFTNPNAYGYPAYSSIFGIVYRMPMQRPPLERPKQGEPTVTKIIDDSGVVMTMNVKRRTVDTLAHAATGSVLTIQLSQNSTNSNTRTPIFPVFDDWAVMTDGAVAILRGREYRVDFYTGDGAHNAGQRLFYPWRPVDDAERTRLVDSINAERRAQYDQMIEDMKKKALDPNQKVGPGGEKIILVGDVPIRTYNGERMPPQTPPNPVLPSEIPDYLPAVERNTASFRADADNRLWVRPKPPPGAPRGAGTIYEILDRTGALVDRVQLPTGKTLAGFGPGGVVYVTGRDGTAVRVERYSFK